MTGAEHREIFQRCYTCGVMDEPSYWDNLNYDSDYDKIAFCEFCADNLQVRDAFDLPMIPVPYLELFYDEKPDWLLAKLPKTKK